MGNSYGTCLTCNIGYFLQPYGVGKCLSFCPTGFLPSGTLCTGNGGLIFDVELINIGPTITTATGQTLLNGATTTFFEASDPIPSQHRGYYFSGSSYLQLPPSANTAGSPLMLAATLSFAVWVRPQGSGIRTIYSKHTGCDRIFVVSLNSSSQLMFQVEYYNAPFSDSTITIVSDQWSLIGVTFEYLSGSQQTIVKTYYNGIQGAYTYTTTFTLVDEYPSAEQYIGVDSGLVSYFKGFIWGISIYNNLHTTFSAQMQGSGCPIGLSFCLSTAPFLQTILGDPCASSCTNGCVRPTDCSFCADVLCDVCSEFDTFGCTTCIPNAEVEVTCKCFQGYFFNSAARICDLCPATCLTCDKATSCVHCYDNASLNALGQCNCVTSFYPNPTSKSCALCSSQCYTCVASAACLSCWPNAQLVANTCICPRGFFGSAESCLACPSGCSRCENSVCFTCLEDYYYLSGACYLICPLPFAGNQNNMQCEHLPIPQSGVMLTGKVEETNDILLNFSQPVTPTLHHSDLSLTLTDAQLIAYGLTSVLTELVTNQTFSLSLTIEGNYLPASNTLSISLMHPEVFADEFGNKLTNSFLALTLYPFESSLPPANHSVSSAMISNTATSSLVAGVSVGLISGNPTTFFAIINNAQMLAYLPLSTIPLPKQLRSQLMAMNIQSFFESPLPALMNTSQLVDPPPQFAQNYGLTSSNFFSNTGTLLASVMCNLGICALVWVLSKVSGSSWFQKMLDGYRWKNLGMHWILSYLDLSIGAFLQVFEVSARQFSFLSPVVGLSSIIGCLAALLSTLLPFVLLYLSMRDRVYIKTNSLEEIRVWAFLYADFKSKGLAPVYYSIFVLRRLIYALTLIFLSSSPFAQSLIFHFHSFFV